MKQRAARIGEDYYDKGVRWRCVGHEPYTRKDGTEMTLAIWETQCRKCFLPVTIKTPLHGFEQSKAFGARNCNVHKNANA